jgi:peptidoglycan/LPS O-acetylase OafA/YrhL
VVADAPRPQTRGIGGPSALGEAARVQTHRRADGTDTAPVVPVRLGSGRLAPLDGIRAIAALAVVAFHLGIGAVGGGFVGVDWFFVLSAFLVGTLLLDQIDRTDTIDLRRFYRRRVGRLLPALVAMVGVMLVVVALSAGELMADAGREAAATVTYISNITLFGVPEHTSFFLHTWTLSLEMQFYLALPFVLLWVRRRGWSDGRLAAGALTFAAAVSALHVVLIVAFPGNVLVDKMPLLDSSRFAVGLALAFGMRGTPARRLHSWCSRWWLAALAAAMMLVDLSVAGHVDVRWIPLHSLAIGVLVAVVIGHVVTQPSAALARFLSLPPLVKIGLMSYSLYLWHFPIFTLLQDGVVIDGHAGLRFGLKMITTAAATWGSWRFVEGRSMRRARVAAS